MSGATKQDVGKVRAGERLSGRARRLLVDSPHSLGAHARARRWAGLLERFPDLPRMRVVDLGGTVEWWQRTPVRPASVVVVNLFEPGEADDPTLVPVTGDACRARAVLADAGVAGDYDLVVSNSLIEHVGGHAKRLELAAEVRALAPNHWVQTPYRYFPIEPHWLCPCLQNLPVPARTAIAYRWPLAHTRPSSREQAQREVMWTELLSASEMRAYFPGSELVRETVAGLTKSLIACTSG